MTGQHKPLVQLELSGGSLQIQTDQVIYMISVNPQAPVGNVSAGPPPVQPLQAPAPAPAAAEPAPQAVSAPTPAQDVSEAYSFYKELSQELYEEIGSLARNLSVELNDLKVDPNEIDLAGSGHALESAKDQLSDIIHMTEKATMTIMDMTDQIQDDVVQAQEFIDAIGTAEYVEDDEHEEFIDQVHGLISANQTIKPLLDSGLILDQEAIDLLAEVVEALGGSKVADMAVEPVEPPPAPEQPAPAPETKVEKLITFPLNDLFQILYELCANDDVKKHIKAIWDKMEDFNPQVVNDSLRAEADSFEKEDEFIMVPIGPLFDALLKSTANDGFKDIIGKLKAAAGQLFLDSSLPVEMAFEEVETVVEAAEQPPAPQPEPVAAPAGDDAAADGSTGALADRAAILRDKLTLHLNQIEESSDKTLNYKINKDVMEKFQQSFVIFQKERESFNEALANSKELVAKIMSSLTQIIESLSFQDLAGQRIQKIVGTLSNIQVELLKILVTFSSRIRSAAETAATEEDDGGKGGKVDQGDVDAMLERLGLGPVDDETDLTAGETAASRLDQGSVDDLLGQLGF